MTLPRVLVPHPHVRVDHKVLGGSPFVEGSRVPVRRLFTVYRSGTPLEKILLRYPQLSPAQVFDALAFALDNPEVIEADIAREEGNFPSTAKKPLSSKGTQQAAFDFAFDATEGPSPSKTQS